MEEEDTGKTKSLFNASQRAKRLKNLLQYADADEELNRDIKVELKEEKEEQGGEQQAEPEMTRFSGKKIDLTPTVSVEKTADPTPPVSPGKKYQVLIPNTHPVKIDMTKLAEAAKGEMVEIDCFYCSKKFKSPCQSATEKCYQAHLKQTHQVDESVVRKVSSNSENEGKSGQTNDGVVYKKVKDILSSPFPCGDCDACFKVETDLERHVFKEHYSTFCEKFL